MSPTAFLAVLSSLWTVTMAFFMLLKSSSTASRALGRCCPSAKAKAVPAKPLPSARLVLLRSWPDPRQQPSPIEPTTCKARLHPEDSGC